MSDDVSARDARLAAEIDADVGAAHVAHVYAEGLLGATEGAGQSEAVLEEFDQLIEALALYPKFADVLASGLISHEEKAAMLDRVVAGRVSPLLLNFLKVLSKHGRLDCLRAIHRQARQQYEQLRRRVRVEVTSATPLDAPTLRRLTDTLRGLVGGEPVFEATVQPALLGGLVVRVGDTVYDASVATQLENVRKQIVHRSAHEIQSRRDRFRYPAGN